MTHPHTHTCPVCGAAWDHAQADCQEWIEYFCAECAEIADDLDRSIDIG